MIRRKTSQKNAIREVFQENDRPLAIEEILSAGRRKIESLDPSTVYRNLKLLVEQGWLSKISHPALGTLYEKSGKAHHHHFHCRFCNRVFELPGCALNEEKLTPPGFVTEGHEVFLFGACASCEAGDSRGVHYDPPQ
jgi:Fur family transcriptional regulator, ferric uptake regulator